MERRKEKRAMTQRRNEKEGQRRREELRGEKGNNSSLSQELGDIPVSFGVPVTT